MYTIDGIVSTEPKLHYGPDRSVFTGARHCQRVMSWYRRGAAAAWSRPRRVEHDGEVLPAHELALGYGDASQQLVVGVRHRACTPTTNQSINQQRQRNNTRLLDDKRVGTKKAQATRQPRVQNTHYAPSPPIIPTIGNVVVTAPPHQSSLPSAK